MIADMDMNLLLTNETTKMYLSAALCSVVFFFARLLLTNLIFKPLGEYMLQGGKQQNGKASENNGVDTKSVKNNNEQNGEKQAKSSVQLSKWNESSWKTSVYAFLTVMEVIAVWGEPWLTDHTQYFTNCMELPCLLPRTDRIIRLYTVAIGFYMYSLPALVFWEARRKDFWASFAHHVVTLALLVYSEQINLTRVGTVILLLHDIDDVWLELAKLCRYCNLEMLMNIFFGVFTLFWFVTRVFIFPVNVIRATMFDSLLEAENHDVHVTPHWEILNSFLVILWVLHIYWSYFILKVAVKALSGQADDVREDDDHED
eukprot:TRINITY_DN34026_c0_g1_i1.p1 TRINITY_DN34026_c0_g1~~TRINITY_DN34026_c0_g1_i1.p1  ORF type:complete len:315 (+),score=35.79 TRINITY_DN34026_c0_g1_i1:182-1126(+)